jgi:hypothetical protein
MIKIIPVEDPSPVKLKVSWYAFIALIAPIKEESKPFSVETRYPTPMIP